MTLNWAGEMNDLRDMFLLNPGVIFLNHGSFGATPRPVFEEYQRWQRELERQPVEFLGRRLPDLLSQARGKLAAYLGVCTDEVVFFPNPTTAINMVARNLELERGDEILTTNHEYGAMDRTWLYICNQTGARYVREKVELPIREKADVIEAFWRGLSDRTRVVFISHITSSTGLRFPVEQICRRARQEGLLTIVDGAHAPGQIDLNLEEIGADFYTGACHKWLCAPKGSAFLYARREVQPMLDPLVVSWGYESEKPSGSQFIDYHEWQGTRDLSAYLSVPAAIEFQANHAWDIAREACRTLASQTRERIHALTGLEPICPDRPNWFAQMFSAPLPKEIDVDELKSRLYEEYCIEVPVFKWEEQPMIRVSVQAYNRPSDLDDLVTALSELLSN